LSDVPWLLKNTRVVASLLALSLASLIVLGSMGVDPTVPISRLPTVESGIVVSVFGILTDLWIHDSGAESLVVTDSECEAVVRVVCSCGILPMPSEYSSIGDELRVTGEISNDRLPPTIFAISNDIHLEQSSEKILTMALLASHWQLFEGDFVDVEGVLVADISGAGIRLVDRDGGGSVRVTCQNLDIAHLNGKLVTVSGTFKLDSSTMAFLIDARDIRIAAG
jgi:hypothetical protein